MGRLALPHMQSRHTRTCRLTLELSGGPNGPSDSDAVLGGNAKKQERPMDEKLAGKLRCTQSLLHQLGAAVAAEAVGVAREEIENLREAMTIAIERARVFDDGSDGADGESAKSVVLILSAALAT